MINKILNKIKDDAGLSELIKHSKRTGVVGGTVRDIYTGNEPKDIDLIILGLSTKEIIEILLPFGFVDEVGKSFGVITYKSKSGEFIDIAIPRKEVKTGNGHKDFKIVADKDLSIDEDLIRRDFTFNSMVLWMDGTIYDPFNGIKSIENKTIEIVNTKAFIEDPLRILRAIQFDVRFKFNLSDTIISLIKKHKEDIKFLPSERITKELEKFSKGTGDFNRGIKLLNELGISEILIGNTVEEYFTSVNLDVFFINLVLNLPKSSVDIIKEKFALGNKFAEYADLFYKYFYGFMVENTEVENALMFMKYEDYVESTYSIFSTFTKGFLDLFLNGILPKTTKELAVSGQEIMEMGFSGKEIGNIQKRLFKLVINGELKNKKEVLKDNIY